MSGAVRADVLRAWLAAAAGGDRVAACRAAALAAGPEPWDVVVQAGALARAELAVAASRIGVSARLRAVDPGDRRALAVVEPGGYWPRWDRRGRRGAGAFDTPREMARAVVRSALAAAPGATSALDPACGPGAFLVALAEAGVRELRGVELDPGAAAVAAVAVPGASVRVGDALVGALEPADVVVGNPPFVPPERQTRAARAALSQRLGWLRGRYDLAVPFAALAVEAAGRSAGLVLPAALLSQPYGAPLRRRWLSSHRVLQLERRRRFPGVSVPVALITLGIGGGPAPVAPAGVSAEDLLALERAPLDPALRPGDLALARSVRRACVALGGCMEVDTGVVAHGSLGGKARLVRDHPEPGALPYVDARDFFSGRRRWIHYRPEAMHRAKRPALFAGEKILLQRLKGAGPVRAAVDSEGLIAGHTLIVIRPLPGSALSLERALAALTHPALAGAVRIEQGARLDLYPKDVRGWPVPRAWLGGAEPAPPLEEALGLDAARVERLSALGLSG